MDRPGNNVKAIFIAALDHEPGAERAAYLDAACGDNADLRRRVEALLAAHERADEVLGPAGEQAGGSVTIDSNAGRPKAEATSRTNARPEVSCRRPRSRPTIKRRPDQTSSSPVATRSSRRSAKAAWAKSGSPSRPSRSSAKWR